MSIWLVRSGKHGEDEQHSLEHSMAIIGWQEMPDISGIATYEDMKVLHAQVYPDASAKAGINNAAQLFSFTKRIAIGDIVVLPLKTRSAIALGKVTGDYKYKDNRHVRQVDWIRPDVPRTDFGQDLLYSFGAFMTVCQIKRNNAEERIQAVLTGKRDPHLSGATGTEQLEEPCLVDLEEQGFDQIRMIIESKFKGHGLTRLVEAILNAQGYQTFRAPEGPDGGVDILAGYGPMGFDQPRICVQVKSGGTQNDIAIRELEGVMGRLNASQGLFVSWDGFTKSALDQTKHLFFKVRLWDDKRLMATLLESYDKLPEQMQGELPLKRIWVSVTDTE